MPNDFKTYLSRESAKQPTFSRPTAFTMIEILIVIAVIVLALALAVPAFNFITGSRSVDGAQNLVSAMLARARSYAMVNQTNAGVAFYLSPVTGKTTMALVASTTATNGVADVTAWTDRSWNYAVTSTPPAPPPPFTTYNQNDSVIALSVDGPSNPSGTSKFIVPPNYEDAVIARGYTALNTFTISNAPNDYPPIDPIGNNGTWNKVSSSGTSGATYDIVADTDMQVLPPGVGCQLINDAKDSTKPPGTDLNQDRYVRTGMILFDREGRLVSTQFNIASTSTWAAQLGGLSTPQIPPKAPFYSQLGLVLYDQQAFINQDGASERDPVMRGAAIDQNELNEETWIDQNATALFVNRYNGSLSKSE